MIKRIILCALVSVAVAPAMAGEPTSARAVFRSLAAELSNDAVEAARSLADDAIHGWTTAVGSDSLASRVLEVAVLFSDAGVNDAAIDFGQRALNILQSSPDYDRALAAEVHAKLAVAYYGSDDLQGARRQQEQAIEIWRTLLAADDPRLVETIEGLGFVHYGLADYAAAASAWQEALNLRTAASQPDHLGLVELEANISEMRRILGDYAAAESHLLAAVARSKEHLPRDGSHAELLNNLGALYWDQSRFDETERLYREALRVFEGDPQAKQASVATARLNLGVVSRDQAKYVEAESLLTQALRLARAYLPGDDAALAYFLNEPAKLYAQTDRWARALPLWDEAVAILSRQQVPQEIYQAQLMHDAAKAQAQRGDLHAAEERFRRALELRESVFGNEHPEVGLTLTELADTLARRRGANDGEAARLAQRATQLLDSSPAAVETRARAFALRAAFDHSKGQRADARRHLERALELVEELRPQRGGNDESRIRFLQDYLGYYNDMISWLVDAGEIENALHYAERVRARVLREQLAASGIDLRRGIAAEILAPLEERERRARLQISQAQRQLTLARSRWTRSNANGVAEIEGLERQLNLGLQQFRSVTEEIKLHSPAWQQLLRRQDARLSHQSIQRELLQAGEWLLLYQTGPKSSYVFAVPAGSGAPECLPLAISEAAGRALGVPPGPLTDVVLADLIMGVRNSGSQGSTSIAGQLRKVTGISPTDAASSAQGGADRMDDARTSTALGANLYWLWQLLLPAEIWGKIHSAPQIVVIPDGALHLLPFEALVITEPRQSRALNYWLDDGPVVRYAHSITTLLDLEARKGGSAPSSGVLSVCDPEFAPGLVGEGGTTKNAGSFDRHAERHVAQLLRSGAALPRLPGTARETQAIQQAFPNGSVEVLSGADASESRVKNSVKGKRYLHFATHGVVDESRGDLLAALVFSSPETASQSGSDDGFLHLFEVYELALNSELAVLSACETSLGRRLRGEGVFALSRGFLAAGSRRTISSLWSVADESTALLMQQFFERVAAAEAAEVPVDYALILRDAKRTLRQHNEWSSPFHWAPFVLSGAR